MLFIVIITLKEDQSQHTNIKKAYNYETTKIELLPGQNRTPVGVHRNDNNSIAAKLLKGVEKSHKKDENLLEQSLQCRIGV